ncbi:hypothetical protein [Cellulosimicrobium sp. TH-20]|uniref:hypothetical protein n=1 Tax=Cellulosimicrobium sp. TH-20 TaxID=1980001 RepID=UPI001E400835|nr:hypothetical protein [Cellulosimicrobium sp. TH-20]
MEAIGHMGFFRRGLRDTLWPELLAWLDARAAAAPSQQDGNVHFPARKPRR